MAGVGVSLVDDRPVELLYFLARGIRAEITATARHRMLSVTVDGLQVWDYFAYFLLRTMAVRRESYLSYVLSVTVDGLVA